MQPISIIIPTLNEVGSLSELFARIDNGMEQAGITYEIILVDDHSTDGTTKLARDLSSSYPVSVLTKHGKPGKAYSLLEGFEAANYDLLCMIDGDLQYPPEAISQMYHKMQFCEADVVLTRRVDNKTNVVRKLSSKVFNFAFAKMLFGIDYDTQSGLKLFRRNVLNTISLSPSPWTFDLEFIVRALERGYVLVSHDITFSERTSGVPKVKMLSATYELASGSIRLWNNSSPQRVKTHFKHLELLDRNYNWIIGIIVGAVTVFATVFGATARASALATLDTTVANTPVSLVVTLPNSPLSTSSTDIAPSSTTTATAPTTSDTPATVSATPVISTFPTTSLASSTSTPSESLPVSVLPISQAITPASVNAPITDAPVFVNNTAISQVSQRPFANSSSFYFGSYAPTNQTYANYALLEPAVATASNIPINPGSSTKDSSSYYRVSNLAQTTTQKLLHAAAIFIGIGTILILTGLLWLGLNRVFKRSQKMVARI